MSVSSLLTYSSMLTKYTREISLESKIGTKLDALSGKIILIQTTKDNTRLKYRIKAITYQKPNRKRQPLIGLNNFERKRED